MAAAFAVFILGALIFGALAWFNHAGRNVKPPRPLRVLCAEGWLSETQLNQFSKRASRRIDLYTYAKPTEFLRQMANSDGKIDVICTSSWLLPSLLRNHWVRRMNYLDMPKTKSLSVDFLHLPYDPDVNYSVPLFWNLYVWLGESQSSEPSLKSALKSQKLAIWGEELNVLQLFLHSGLRTEERLGDEDSKSLGADFRAFLKSTGQIWNPDLHAETAGEMLDGASWIQLPLARAQAYLTPKYHFKLPTDGGAMELGLLAVGAKSEEPRLAQELINDLLEVSDLKALSQRLQVATTLKSELVAKKDLNEWLRPEALRLFPLDRLRFPDVKMEILPRFEPTFEHEVLGTENRD